jgi:hypothetical protein
MEGALYKYPHEKYIKDGNDLAHLGFQLKSVKGPGNTFDLNSKWSRTLPSLIYFSWDIYRDPPSIKKIKYQS